VRFAIQSILLLCLLLPLACPPLLCPQEAPHGIDLRATITGQTIASNESTENPRSGSPLTAGARVVLYPTFKINRNWFVTGALQLSTRPYFFSDLSSQGYGAKGLVLQSTLNYAHISNKGSLLWRAGQMSSSFGSFLLRYDDADNALVDLPLEYGYYYAPVSILGVAAVQVDLTRGKWDARAQFANSSPANPRSLFSHDQYGNWAGGAGYTIRQGLRAGVSAYRGPYLDRQYPRFLPGEANPNTLPARALGLDANWARGHTSALGEWQHFIMPYKAIPTFRESTGYAELKQVLSPRWYLAVRNGYSTANASGKHQTLEAAAAFRPNRFQLIKFGYENEHYSKGSGRNDNTLAIQIITSLHHSNGWK